MTFLPLRLVTSYPAFILFAISACFIRCHILHSSGSLYPQKDQHPQTTSSVQQTQADCLSEHSILIHSKGAKRPILGVRFPHIQQIYQWRAPGGVTVFPWHQRLPLAAASYSAICMNLRICLSSPQWLKLWRGCSPLHVATGCKIGLGGMFDLKIPSFPAGL